MSAMRRWLIPRTNEGAIPDPSAVMHSVQCAWRFSEPTDWKDRAYNTQALRRSVVSASQEAVDLRTYL
jgi:hypothetical protein